MNKRLLEAKMVEKGISTDEMAKELNISPETFWRKKKGKSDFYRKEIKTICDVLSLSGEETIAIFFGNQLA